MRLAVFGIILGISFGVGAALPGDARAGVPRSCIHPQADVLACLDDTRRLTERVMPAARVRALRAQRRYPRRAAPLEDRRGNPTLHALDERLRCRDC